MVQLLPIDHFLGCEQHGDTHYGLKFTRMKKDTTNGQVISFFFYNLNKDTLVGMFKGEEYF